MMSHTKPQSNTASSLPARAVLKCIRSHNALHGCERCLSVATWLLFYWYINILYISSFRWNETSHSVTALETSKQNNLAEMAFKVSSINVVFLIFRKAFELIREQQRFSPQIQTENTLKPSLTASALIQQRLGGSQQTPRIQTCPRATITQTNSPNITLPDETDNSIPDWDLIIRSTIT